MTNNNRRYTHNNRGRGGAPTKGVFETVGPGGRFRGTVHQLVERYVALGKDALLRREYTRAEDLFQHAEHYRRMGGVKKRPENSREATSSPVVQDNTAAQDVPGASEVNMAGDIEPSDDAVGGDVSSSSGDGLPSFLLDDDTASVPGESAPKPSAPAKPKTPTVSRPRRRSVPKKESPTGDLSE